MAAWRAAQEKKEQEQKDDMERAQIEVQRLTLEVYDERSRRRAAAASGDKKAWFPSDDQTSWENDVVRIGGVSRALNWYTPNKMEAALQSRRKLVSAGLIPDKGTETVVSEDGSVDMNMILMLAAIGAGIFLLTRNS